MHVSTRLGVLALALAALAPEVQAQTTNPTNPAAFSKDDFTVKLEIQDGEKFILPNPNEEKLYFNRARCECDVPVAIRIELTATGVMKQNATNQEGMLKLYVGPATCVDTNSATRAKDTECTLLATLPSLPQLAAAKIHEVKTTVGKLFRAGGTATTRSCSSRFTQSVWMWIDADSNGSPDEGISGSSAPTLPIDFDGEAPAVPSQIVVEPGNEALTVHWKRPTVSADVAGALVFCSRADLPVFAPADLSEPSRFYAAKDYYSPKIVCPPKKVVQPQIARIASAQTDSMDAGATPLYQPDAFGSLDPAFLCSELLTTASDWRIKGLQNGIKYVVGVASVDTHGNASPIDTTYIQTPVLTKDFYRGYREAGGEATGCAYGSRAGAGGLVLALAALALAGARRRR